MSPDKVQLFAVDPSDKYVYENNNQVLTITNVDSSDESYYACGYTDALNNFYTYSSYYLFVKGKIRYW